jgi:hypothetical protein
MFAKVPSAPVHSAKSDSKTSAGRLVVKDFPGNLALIRLVPGICMNSYSTQPNHVVLSLTCTGRVATNHAKAGHVLHVSNPFVFVRSVKPTLAQPHRDTADTAHLC